MLTMAASGTEYATLPPETGEYIFENGRRYHGYKAGRYMLPNDEVRCFLFLQNSIPPVTFKHLLSLSTLRPCLD